MRSKRVEHYDKLLTTLEVKREIGKLSKDAAVLPVYDTCIDLSGRRSLIYVINMFQINRFAATKTGIKVNGHAFNILTAIDGLRAATGMQLQGVAAGLSQRRTAGFVYDNIYLLVSLGLIVRSRHQSEGDKGKRVYYHLSALGKSFCEAINREIDYIESTQPVFNFVFNEIEPGKVK